LATPRDRPPSQRRELIRVCVVDDEAEIRACIQETLELSGDFICVGSYCSGEEALKEIPPLVPELVLLDIRMPGMSGVECARRLKQLLPALVVVFVSAYADPQTMLETLQTGADAFVVKPLVIPQFLTTLRFVTGRHSAREMNAGSIQRDRVKLNNREAAVMEGLAAGLLYKEIADRLRVTVCVVHKLQHKVFLKLHVTNRTEAVQRWFGRV